MAYRALKSFTGRITMTKGEVREINDEALVKDLLRVGAVVDLSEKQKTAKGSKATKSKGGESAND